MRAVRNTEDGVAVVQVPDPEPGADQVRIRVRSTGICGSDFHILEWGPRPVTLGHEFAGLLDDGTPVAVEPQVPCGTCDRCLAGAGQQCRTIFDRTYGFSLDGGLADEVLVHPSCVVPLPAGIDLTQAGLVEPLAVAVHALHRGGVEAGSRVLVVGGGSIGLAVVAAARWLGADVTLSARHDHQVRAGERLGAGAPTRDDHDVVIDAAGTQSSLDQAVRQVRPGGTVVAAGTYWSPVQIGVLLSLKEVVLVPSVTYGEHGGHREFDEAAEVLAATPELADTMITHRFGLDDAAEAFRVAADRSAGAIKVQLTP